MDLSAIIVVVALTALAFGSIVWKSIPEKANRRRHPMAKQARERKRTIP